MYRYILFDADGTLLDFNHDMELAFYTMYESAGLDRIRPATPALLRQYDDINMKWWAAFERGACTKPEIYVNRFRDFFREADYPGFDPVKTNDCYFAALGASGTMLPGAVSMLEELNKRYGIYIVTNGNAQTQHTRLRISGLLNYVKDYFISDDAGAAKPDKRYFDYVLSRIPNAAPADCIVIGDSLSADIKGAENAGMDCIWYNPRHEANPSGLPMVLEAHDYEAILSFLK